MLGFVGKLQNLFAPVPWWGTAYLVVVGAFFLVGVFDDFFGKKLRFAFAGILSFSLIAMFVVGFFNDDLARFLGWSVIPLVIFSILWEFYEVQRDLKHCDDAFDDMTEEEKKTAINFVLLVGNLLIVPGQLAGIALSLRYLGKLSG